MTNQKHILIIEDDLDLSNAIASTLQRNGYNTFEAGRRREAIFKLQNQIYACILLDMRLGMDSGEEMIDVARKGKDSMNKNTPILVISGHLDGNLVKKIANRIQGALVKPFEMSALLEIVKKNAD